VIRSKGLSHYFWPEATNYDNYIVNHIPIEDLKNIKMEEPWSEIKLDVIHFCAFGSATWAHILDEKRKALQPKSEKYIFFWIF